MEFKYNGDHSVTFYKTITNGSETTLVRTNTWSHLRLLPSSRPTMPQPQAAYKYVDIPGRDGPLDLTGYLTGKPTFGNRQGTLDFIVVQDSSEQGQKDWVTRKKELAQFFDGSEMKIEFDDEVYETYQTKNGPAQRVRSDAAYYKGRVFFRGWTPGAQYSTVSLEYNVEPYRYKKSNDEKEVDL